MTSTAKILDALSTSRLDGAEIQKLTGLWTIELYPTLMRMERAGELASDWLPGEYPRKRVYWIEEAKDGRE